MRDSAASRSRVTMMMSTAGMAAESSASAGLPWAEDREGEDLIWAMPAYVCNNVLPSLDDLRPE